MIVDTEEKVAWFDVEGRGPAEIDLAVHVFEHAPGGASNVGLNFIGLGGPLLTADQAERIAQNLLLAANLARAGAANLKVEG